mmetsp:Transcript_22073/g.36559  ORF Transcript_22073/g.36559 Transcript_22073/m.36559 type:complete len:370 (+) Transcript_22073:75-1184(+)
MHSVIRKAQGISYPLVRENGEAFHSRHSAIVAHETRENPKPPSAYSCNLAYGSGAFVKIVSQLRDPDVIVREKALSVVGGMAVDQVKVVQLVTSDILVALVDCCLDPIEKIRMLAVQAVISLLANENCIVRFVDVSQKLRPLLTDEMAEVRYRFSHLLLRFAETNQGQEALLQQSYIKLLIDRYRLEDGLTQEKILRVLSILVKTPAGTKDALSSGIMACLLPVVLEPSVRLQRQAIQCLATMCEHTEAKQAAIEHKLVPILTASLHGELAIEAACLLMNMSVEITAKEEIVRQATILQHISNILEPSSNSSLVLRRYALQLTTNITECSKGRELFSNPHLVNLVTLCLSDPSVAHIADRCLAQIRFKP